MRGFDTYRRLVPAAALAAALALAACTDAEDEEEADNAAAGAVSVTYVEAELDTVEDVERALATIEAKSAPQIAAEVAATVREIFVEEGDRVAAGQVLATLDPTDFEIEQARAGAEIGRLQAMIENQEREVARQSRLQDQGHVPAATFESSQAELNSLSQQLAGARANLTAAERNIARAAIRAPDEGAVVGRRVSVGDYVNAGTVMFEMTHDSRLQVRIPLPETVAERLEIGLPVRLDSASANGGIMGEITQIRPQVSSASRAISILAEIDNPGRWRPGSSADAELILDSRESVTLPPTSVVRRASGMVVFVVEDGIASERVVELGRRSSEWVEIADGVEAGMHVVVDGAGFLADGMQVQASPRGGGDEEEQSADAGEAAAIEPEAQAE